MKRLTYTILTLIAAICILSFTSPVWAQEAEPVIAPTSIWFDVWQIVQPVVVIVSSTVFPVLGIWISARLAALLKITDEKQRQDIETGLRNALHESAANAMKYALARYGVGTMVSEVVVGKAMSYVASKNPEALSKLGVDNVALREIVLSKSPEFSDTKVQPSQR